MIPWEWQQACEQAGSFTFETVWNSESHDGFVKHLPIPSPQSPQYFQNEIYDSDTLLACFLTQPVSSCSTKIRCTKCSVHIKRDREKKSRKVVYTAHLYYYGFSFANNVWLSSMRIKSWQPGRPMSHLPTWRGQYLLQPATSGHPDILASLFWCCHVINLYDGWFSVIDC